VRHVLRLHHYSIHTERSSLDWIKRKVHFHHMRFPEDLADGERKVVVCAIHMGDSPGVRRPRAVHVW
jgi:hypothetical protein